MKIHGIFGKFVIFYSEFSPWTLIKKGEGALKK
jgi:hypothetical protein